MIHAAIGRETETHTHASFGLKDGQFSAQYRGFSADCTAASGGSAYT